MFKRILGALVVILTAAGCRPPLKCGDGTRDEGGACVTTTRCAAGTHEENGECLADPFTQINCGTGTHLDGTACVVDGTVDLLSPWSAPVPICEEGLSCGSPSLLQTPAGALVVVSESDDSSLRVGVYRQTSTGFVLAKRFEGDNGVAMSPTVAMRGSTVYLAFTDYEPSGGQEYGPGDLKLATSADFGVTWSAPRRITSMPATSLLYSPRLTVSAAGIDLLFIDTDGRTTSENMYAHSDDDGLTFSEPARLPAGSAYDSIAFGITAGARVGGALEVAVMRSGYEQSTGSELTNVEVLTISPGPAMDTQTSKVKRVFASRDFPLDPVPVLDVSEAGVRCLAYVDAPSRDFSVFVVRSESALDGSQRPVLLPGGPGSVQMAPSILATPEGDCELAWLDNRTGAWEVYEAALKADGTWRAPRKVSPMGFTEDGITRTLDARVVIAQSATARQLAWTDFRDGIKSVSFSSAPK